jgi:cation:H+ antiporter
LGAVDNGNGVIALWVAAVVGGLALTILSSQQTLDSAQTVALRLGLSPFIIGMTVVAIGTDLPEIANSITASYTGHGDINVGDSIGSVVTQITLVLGILCFVATIKTERRFVGAAGTATLFALLVGAVLLDDDHLSRSDGLILIACWILGTIAVQKSGHVVSTRQERLFDRGLWVSLRGLAIGLGGVAVGATIAVRGFTEIAATLDVPEYAISFLVLSLGTSLPELVLDAKALRQGETSLAMGDIVGSSFVDATLSLGVGPAMFATAVSSSAQRGSLIAFGIVAGAVVLLVSRQSHGRLSGLILIGLYALGYAVVLA